MSSWCFRRRRADLSKPRRPDQTSVIGRACPHVPVDTMPRAWHTGRVPNALSQLWENRPSAVRRRLLTWTRAYNAEGLTDSDVDELARYNTRVSQGVRHTAEYTYKMAIQQAAYNRALLNRWSF